MSHFRPAANRRESRYVRILCVHASAPRHARGIGPTAALVRYRERGEGPMHEHKGYEHILILAGSQRDENGTFEAGTLVINPPGTRHKASSDDGCIVLAIYEKPVRFV